MTEKVKHERHKDDFYETPEWVVKTYMSHHSDQLMLMDSRWLEPSFGNGAIIGAVWRWAHHNWSLQHPNWTAIDINQPTWENRKGIEPVCDEILTQNFLEYPVRERPGQPGEKFFDVCMMNPPYSNAQAHIEHAIKHSRVVIALLRLGFMASQKRAKFHQQNPSNVLVLPKRPSFTGGGTDKYDYGWFTFGTFKTGSWNVAHIPQDVRKKVPQRA